MAGGCGHTQSEHDAIREDDEQWSKLRFVGYQAACYGTPDLEMRNIVGTECTITRPCVLTEEQRVEARAAARLKYETLMGKVRAQLAVAA